MKGCVCEKGNFLISYKDELSRVKSVRPDWTPHQVRVEVAEILRPRFRQDRTTKKMENSENAEYKVPDEFMLTPDGRAYWKGYGRYMSELNSRTKTLTPDQYYSAEDHVTDAIESALRQGARTIIAAYPRTSNDVGDVLVISYDPVANKGKMKVVNTALDGKTYKQHEAVSLVAKRYDVITHILHNSLLVATDKNVSLNHTRKQLQEDQPAEVRFVERIQGKTIPAIVETALETTNKVAKDVQTTLIAAGVFGIETIRRRRLQKEVLEDKQQTEVSSQKNIDSKTTREFSNKLQLSKSVLTETSGILKVAATLSETGVGAGAMLFVLQQIRQQEKRTKKTKKEKYIRKSKKAIQVEVFRQTERKRKKRVKKVEKKGAPEKRSIENKRLRRIKRTAQEVFARWKITKEQKKVLKRKEGKEKQQEKDVIRKEQGLWHVLRVLTKLINQSAEQRVQKNKDSSTAPLRIEKKKSQRKEKRLAARFAFAWALWLLLHTKALTDHSQNLHILIYEEKQRREEHLVVKEPIQWVLLAIIWYLVMIRESRGAGSRFAGQIHPKKQAAYPPPGYQMPPRGVIFTSAS